VGCKPLLEQIITHTKPCLKASKEYEELISVEKAFP
jgi:hypothetical protein